MRLPKQTACVDRDLNANASDGGHVAPSGWSDVLGTVAKIAVPILSSII